MAAIIAPSEEEMSCSRCRERPRAGRGRNTWCSSCKAQWQRAYRAGVRRQRRVADPVRAADGCLEWQGVPNPVTGYASRTIAGRSRYVHRLAWEQVHGEIPEGFTIDHLCCNKVCVEVEHMELVTRAENTRRAWERRRAA